MIKLKDIVQQLMNGLVESFDKYNGDLPPGCVIVDTYKGAVSVPCEVESFPEWSAAIEKRVRSLPRPIAVFVVTNGAYEPKNPSMSLYEDAPNLELAGPQPCTTMIVHTSTGSKGMFFPHVQHEDGRVELGKPGNIEITSGGVDTVKRLLHEEVECIESGE